MIITRHNINEIIEDYLKSLKIRYNIIYTDEYECVYEIFVSSLSAYIQVEYNLDDEKDTVVFVQFYVKLNKHEEHLYKQVWENKEDSEPLELEIDELIHETKKINLVINQISQNIENIKAICEDNGLEFWNIINRFKFN